MATDEVIVREYLHALTTNWRNRGVLLNYDIICLEAEIETKEREYCEMKRAYRQLLQGNPQTSPQLLNLADRVRAIDRHMDHIRARLQRMHIHARFMDRAPMNQIRYIFK